MTGHDTSAARLVGLNWPEAIAVPLLILHGADDHEVPVTSTKWPLNG